MSGIMHTTDFLPGIYDLTKRLEVDDEGRGRFVDVPGGQAVVVGFWPSTLSRITRVGVDELPPTTLEPDRSYPDGALWITGEDVSVAVHLVEGQPTIWVGSRRYSLAAARRLTRAQEAAVRYAEQLAANVRTETADA